jgi:hypothetical protein
VTPWEFWAGSYGNFEYEDAFELGGYATREAAIEAGRAEWPGKVFYIVEGRASTAARYYDGSYETIPFKRQRNRELIEPVASVAVDQIVDHIKSRAQVYVARRDRLKPKWWQFRMKRDWENLEGMASELDLIAVEIQDLIYDS